MVPQGEQEKRKVLIGEDYSTAHFPVLRLFLSLAVFKSFQMASILIKVAYRKSAKLIRDLPIYLRPPRAWASSRRIIWHVIRQVYGLSESGSLWQLDIEFCLQKQGFTVIGLQGMASRAFVFEFCREQTSLIVCS